MKQDELPSLSSMGTILESLSKEDGLVSRFEKERRFRQRAVTLWFTGLSGSGKTTLSVKLERALFDLGYAVSRLDGDNIRRGINSDLGFSTSARKENVRRMAEVARILNDSGQIVLCSLISPMEVDRLEAKRIITDKCFAEVYVDAPLAICESRDPKGLYAKARAGLLADFTGLDSPYEAPIQPDIRLPTGELNIDECNSVLIAFLLNWVKLPGNL